MTNTLPVLTIPQHKNGVISRTLAPHFDGQTATITIVTELENGAADCDIKTLSLRETAMLKMKCFRESITNGDDASTFNPLNYAALIYYSTIH